MTTKADATAAEPTYLSVIADQGFDPASVTPPHDEMRRKSEHDLWLQETWRKVKAADLSKPVRKPRAKKAS